MSNNLLITNRNINFTINSSGSGTANINFPQKVKQITFKAVAYQAAVASSTYGYITSDLVGWQTLGVVFRNSSAGVYPFIDIKYQIPQLNNVSGIYNFQLYNLDGSIPTSINGDLISIIAEFVSELS
jgi:hypothetical protein